MEEVPADLLPDHRVERGRSNMAWTAPRAPRQSRGPAPVKVWRRHVAAACGPHARTLQAARAAAHQPPEQPALLVQIARTELLIRSMAGLRAGEGRRVDERGNRDRDPLGWRSRRSPPASGPALGGGDGGPAGGVVVEHPEVGLTAHEPVHGGLAPLRAAAGRGVALTDQPPGDLADGHAVVGVPGKHLADHRGLRVIYHQVRRAAVLAGDAAVAVGNAVPNDLPLPGPIELPPAIAFRDLGALVFGDRPLDLHQQQRVRIVGRGLREEDHRDRETLELLQQEKQVRILAGQPVGVMYQHRIERAGVCPVAEPVELRTSQLGAGVVVSTHVGLGHVGVRRPRMGAQRVDLGVDGVSFLSRIRDAGIQRHFHHRSSLVLTGNPHHGATEAGGPTITRRASCRARPGSTRSHQAALASWISTT